MVDAFRKFESDTFRKLCEYGLGLATENSQMVHKHAALLVSGRKVIHADVNCRERSFFDGIPVPGYHAEISCLARWVNSRRGKKQKRKYRQPLDMIVIRVANLSHQNECFGPSKPCSICLQHMKRFGIRRVFYYMDGHWCMKTTDELDKDPLYFSLGARMMNPDNFIKGITTK